MKKSLLSVPKRLQRMLLRLYKFDSVKSHTERALKCTWKIPSAEPSFQTSKWWQRSSMECHWHEFTNRNWAWECRYDCVCSHSTTNSLRNQECHGSWCRASGISHYDQTRLAREQAIRTTQVAGILSFQRRVVHTAKCRVRGWANNGTIYPNAIHDRQSRCWSPGRSGAS